MSEANWKTILAATDFSPWGNQAVDYAHRLAERFGAELHVLHVARNASDAAVLFGATGIFDASEAGDADAKWLGSILGESGSVRRVESMQIGDDVAQKIVRYSRVHNIDVIVMATHGRSGVVRFWLGSLTDEVIRSADCPVLVIRPVAEENTTARPVAKYLAAVAAAIEV